MNVDRDIVIPALLIALLCLGMVVGHAWVSRQPHVIEQHMR